ncbi:MAG: hypothetical protein Q9164_005769 [Protoblastenia rupestris]
MAGWRARGYVADSDEDEESQGSLNLQAKWKGDGKDKSGASVEEQGHEVGEDGNGTKELDQEEEAISKGGHVIAVEVRIANESSLKNIKDGRPHFHKVAAQVGDDCEGLTTQSRLPAEDEDIDELQQDQYEAIHEAQSQAKLLAGFTSGEEIVVPFPTTTIEESTRQSQLLQRNNQPQGLSSSDPERLQISSVSSSPLSDAYSLPDLSQSLIMPSTADIARSSREGEGVALATNLETSDLIPPQSSPLPRSARNLRQRNPIQLHPYAIESEKYRQILHARGLKALRFAQGESQQNVEDYTQNQDFQGPGSQSSRSSSPRPSSRHGSSSSPIAPQHIALEDEFPDMEDLLARQSGNFVCHGFKRRKMNKPVFKPPPSLPARKESPLAEDRTQRIHDDEDVYNVPLSPARSGSQSSSEPNLSIVPKFRVPPQLSPKALPTPTTSSEPRRPPQPDSFEAEASNDQTLDSAQSEESSEVQPAASEDETYHQLYHVQRKIRGVLPASWLKLDLKTRTKKPFEMSRGPTSASPEKRSVQRGVAHPVKKTGSRTLSRRTSHREAFGLSDDSDVSGEDGTTQDETPVPRRVYHLDDDIHVSSMSIDRYGEAMEDDEVDAMLPSMNRLASHSHRNKKHQTRMLDYGVDQVAKARRTWKKPCLGQRKHFRPQPKPHHVGEPMPKFRPPKLSILDAPSMADTECTTPVPKFLKIASRTVRCRRDNGRHSPSRKYLKLATASDTYEASQTLQKWREGTIKPHPSHSIASISGRQPLLPRSVNVGLHPGLHKPGAMAKSTRQAESLRKASHWNQHFVKNRVIQSSLDTIVSRRSEGPLPTALQTDLSTKSKTPKVAQKQRRQLGSSLQTTTDSRPALLETLQEDEDRAHPQSAFRRDLSRVNLDKGDVVASKSLWNRNLGTSQKQPAPDDARNDDLTAEHISTDLRKEVKTTKLRKQRKRPPHHLEISTPSFRQPSSSIPLDELPFQSPQYQDAKDTPNGCVLTGLGPFGTRYTSTFDITPLPAGTCFHSSTLLGSGDFQRSLKLSDCDLDSHRGFTTIFGRQQTFRWGPWTETMSSELDNLLGDIIQQAPREWSVSKLNTMIDLQRQTVRYFSDYLSFLDPIDRVFFLQRWANVVITMSLEYCDLRNVHHDTVCQVGTLNLVIVNQLRQISKHPSVPHNLRDDMETYLSKCARLMNGLLCYGLGALTMGLANIKTSRDNAPVLRNAYSAEALVIARHVLEDNGLSTVHFWDISPVHATPMHAASHDFVVEVLEDCWEALFTVLPYIEIDAQGVLETGRRFKIASDNWVYVRRLISPVLDAYMSNPKRQAPSFNTYCRALFSRCLHLINAWGWRRCDTIIGTLFDFFARNNLNHLKNEETRGSPDFLEHLDANPGLIAEPDDRCFHLLLKIIGSGVKHMRHLYPDKKIRDLVWRLMPNHGRSHPKEETIKQEDLNALRNHHDLLCTLYWASPPGFRPQVGVIRNLVHLESSHREACHINIRAWSNLVQFQLSTKELISSLEPFVHWHEDLVHEILQQHRLARTEAEEQVRSVQRGQSILVSQQLLESTIARNQRQVEAVLSDALFCVRRAIQSAGSQEAADMLLSHRFPSVFSLFDSARPQTSTTTLHSLDVLTAYTEKCTQLARPAISGDDNDDSQDYGDWPASSDGHIEDKFLHPRSSPLQQTHDPLRLLLSNCFGADNPPSDNLLSKVVDVWITVGQSFVRTGFKSWADYIGRFGNDSWSSLRNTEQTRKYSAYYLAQLLEMNPNLYTDYNTFFLKFWFQSLVERESLLKFQHKLTSSVLNVGRDSDLLINLPFWRSQPSGRFEITAPDFRERRLSLISSLLSNIRLSVENASLDPSFDAASLKQDYRELLKHLMGTMKHNYQELGHGADVKGTYVDFVHKIVEFLQQHASSICPIDRFFTDNTAFPLPANDPNYIVGQLKSYALRLQYPRAPKELTVFLQSVSERAAIDGQQSYLVDQLYIAMSGGFEDGTSKPTLRALIVKAILPAYIEMAVKTTCGWILAIPFLLAIQKIFHELLLSLDGFHAGSVESLTFIIIVFFGSVCGSIEVTREQPILFERPSTLKTLRACYEAATALLPTLDYLVRLDGSTTQAEQDILFLDQFATDLVTAFESNDGALPAGPRSGDPGPGDKAHADIQSFATSELQQTLEKTWICVDERYFVAKGTSRREVMVDIGLMEEEKEDFRKALDRFLKCLDDMPALGRRDDMKLRNRMVGGLEDLVF